MFATCSGFEEKRLLRPKFTRTDLQSPRKTAPVRRLTVNRKPLSTASRLHFHQNSPSLAQPPMLRNGLYPTPGHLLAFDRLPPAGGPKKTGQRPAPRVRSSFAYRAAMALHEKEISCARLLRSLSFARYEASVKTRSNVGPNSFLAVSGISTTPASVIGAPVSQPSLAITGNPHAMPAIALPRRLDTGPFVKSSTSLAPNFCTTSSAGSRP